MNLNPVLAMAVEYVLVVIGLLLGHKCFSLRNQGMNYFWRFVMVLNGFLIVNVPIRLFELKIYSFNPTLMFWLYAASVVFMTFVMYYWFLFMLKLLDSRFVNTRLKIHFSFIPAFLSVPLCVINWWTGWLYRIDGDTYYRGSVFVLQGAIAYIYLGLNIIWLIYCLFSKKTRKLALTGLYSMLPPIVGIIFQILYGGSFLLAGITIGAVLMYIDICLDRQKSEEMKEMKEMFVQTAETLASAIDAKDEYTHGHSIRVAQYSRKIAEMAGLSEENSEKVYFSGLLHDVGKIGIPDWIINKQDRLTPEEFNVIKQHPVKGREILAHIRKLPYLTIGAKYHHERYDGLGYPEHLKATDIPEIARIIAVADAYDAMTSSRSYRKPLPQNVVREEIIKGSGKQFDPVFADIMVRLIDQDVHYKMKQNENSNELYCMEYGKNFYEGIPISPYESRLSFRSEKLEKGSDNIPTIFIFDAVDGRVHIEDEEKKFYSYYDYCSVRIDGRYERHSARNMKVSIKKKHPVIENIESISDIEVYSYKKKDHIFLKISDEYVEVTVTIALPDNSRYAYIGITGKQCYITDIKSEITGEITAETEINRIAEEVKYFDMPDGDIPNLQVDSWCTEFTKGIPLKDELKISFHMKSMPFSRLIWHCPFIILFDSEDGVVHGKGYKNLAFIRLDGESWQESTFSMNELKLTKTDEYKDWPSWKEGNKAGRDIEIFVKREGKFVTIKTECGGLILENKTSVSHLCNNLFVSLTGDQVVLESIKIN